MSSSLVPLYNAEARLPARGVVFVHSCPRALSPHVEWALAQVLGMDVSLDWIRQPVAPGHVRAELSWQASPGTGSALIRALRSFVALRYEVTEEPTPGREGERFSVTPDLGVFRATIGIHGDAVVTEDRLRALLANAAPSELVKSIRDLLGAAWDDELEPFRYAGDGAPVRWLHRVG